MNTDQGLQFASEAYIEAVESTGVAVSMDGLKLGRGRGWWFADCNESRPH